MRDGYGRGSDLRFEKEGNDDDQTRNLRGHLCRTPRD